MNPRRVRIALAAAATALVAAAPATATQGVRIDLGRIDVKQHLLRGGTYRLPTIGVSNPGTVATTYRMAVSHVEGVPGRPIPAGWIHYSVSEFSLAPGATRAVGTRLEVPLHARPAAYSGLVEAAIVSHGRGATIGGAAAAHLTFRVEPSNLLEALWLRFTTWMSDGAPWSYLVPSLLLACLLALAFRRRFGLRLSIERKASS